KVFFRCEHLVEDKVARTLTVFLEKVDEILGVTAQKRDQWQSGGAQLLSLSRFCMNLGNDRICPSREFSRSHCLAQFDRLLSSSERRRRPLSISICDWSISHS